MTEIGGYRIVSINNIESREGLMLASGVVRA
jgi:hypothetical protein